LLFLLLFLLCYSALLLTIVALLFVALLHSLTHLAFLAPCCSWNHTLLLSHYTLLLSYLVARYLTAPCCHTLFFSHHALLLTLLCCSCLIVLKIMFGYSHLDALPLFFSRIAALKVAPCYSCITPYYSCTLLLTTLLHFIVMPCATRVMSCCLWLVIVFCYLTIIPYCYALLIIGPCCPTIPPHCPTITPNCSPFSSTSWPSPIIDLLPCCSLSHLAALPSQLVLPPHFLV
jgi:hypothetical protein